LKESLIVHRRTLPSLFTSFRQHELLQQSNCPVTDTIYIGLCHTHPTMTCHTRRNCPVRIAQWSWYGMAFISGCSVATYNVTWGRSDSKSDQLCTVCAVCHAHGSSPTEEGQLCDDKARFNDTLQQASAHRRIISELNVMRRTKHCTCRLGTQLIKSLSIEHVSQYILSAETHE